MILFCEIGLVFVNNAIWVLVDLLWERVCTNVALALPVLPNL